MDDLILRYYVWLSGLFAALATPVDRLATSLNLPLVSALLFGLLGTTAPCQLSTNVAALAYVSRGAGDSRRVWAQTAAFVAGKVTVYLLVGGLIVLLGLQLNQIGQAVIPVVVVTRRLLGPLLILVGLVMLGVLRFHQSPGRRLSAWIEQRVGERQGIIPAYLLGVAFSFTFCPTLFTLFFGLTIPLAIASPGGVLFPGVFAVGTALPVLGFGALLASDAVNTRAILKRVKTANIWIRRLSGALFILIGIHEIVLYWLL